MTTHTYLAPAKVNLNLRVVGRRGDGYHLLDSVMTFFPLYDRLEVTVCGVELELAVEPAVTLEPRDNLVWRAAELLRGEAGVTPGVHLRLVKGIPAAAGLGGGSSDAATTLLALDREWQLGLGRERLLELGLRLGADVPFFIGGAAARATGVGERLAPLPGLNQYPLVVINPGTPLATRSVFQEYAALRDRLPATAWSTHDGVEFGNDLEPAAAGLAPVITAMRAALEREGARVAMISGSGPTVFGLFSTVAAARAAEQRLRAPHPGWKIFSGVTFNLHPFYIPRQLC